MVVNNNNNKEHIIVIKDQCLAVLKSFNAIDSEIFSEVSKEDQDTFNKVLCQLSSKLKELPATDLFFNYKKTGRKKKTVASDKV